MGDTRYINPSDFVVVQRLNARNSVFAVENRVTGERFIKKYIDSGSIEVYKKMLNIRHENIASVYAIFNDNGMPAVLEEYISGEKLATIMEEVDTLEISYAKNVMLQLCEGLNIIHRAGIVHRDITPNNILIDDYGVVKIIDLDISRIKKEKKNVDTVLMGTEGYTSPEQFGFRQTDERADIYSLGVLFNAMLTGFLPVEKKYKGDIVIEKIISRCTEIEASRRYKTVKDLKGMLLSVATEKDSAGKRFLKTLPGFRTHESWKMVFSSIVYIFMIVTLCFCASFPLLRIDFEFFFEFISMYICTIILPWLIGNNYLYFMDRIPLVRRLSSGVKLGILVVLAFTFSFSSFWILYEIYM